MKFGVMLTLVCLMIGVAAPSGGAADESDNGLDPTNPLTRLSLKYQYQNLPPSEEDTLHNGTLRGDLLFKERGTWGWSTRVELPLIVTDQASRDNPNGGAEFGIGDVLTQAIIINRPSDAFAWMAGSQFIFPTASQDQMGGGKYRIVPSAAARWRLPGLRKGSWFAPLVRYDADVAGADDRNRIRELQLAPILNLTLEEGWFLNLYPSSDIKYNFADERPGDTGKWFVPFDFLVGRNWSESTFGTLEVAFPLVQQYQVYDLKIEANIYFLFG